MLEYIFVPVFEATVNPQAHKELSVFLRHVSVTWWCCQEWGELSFLFVHKKWGIGPAMENAISGPVLGKGSCGQKCGEWSDSSGWLLWGVNACPLISWGDVSFTPNPGQCLGGVSSQICSPA